jgi:hypothetical protein
MLRNYQVNSKSVGHSRKNSNNTPFRYNRGPNIIRQEKVVRPIYIPPPQYKYSLAKSPGGKNNFDPGLRQFGTPSTNGVLGKKFI